MPTKKPNIELFAGRLASVARAARVDRAQLFCFLKACTGRTLFLRSSPAFSCNLPLDRMPESTEEVDALEVQCCDDPLTHERHEWGKARLDRWGTTWRYYCFGVEPAALPRAVVQQTWTERRRHDMKTRWSAFKINMTSVVVTACVMWREFGGFDERR